MTAALLRPDQMAMADRLTIEGGVPGIELMERAGAGVARAAMALVQPSAKVLILCGPGNNGGDGFIAARVLRSQGYSVLLGVLKEAGALKGDAALAYDRMGLPVFQVLKGEAVSGGFMEALKGADLVVDALFGAGLDRPLMGAIAELVACINEAGKQVLAVDLPSGVNGANGTALGDAIKACATVTFFCLKPGHLMYPGRALCGPVSVVDIGIEEAVLDKVAPDIFQNAPELWGRVWPVPDPLGHKYSKGHAVVFGGPVSATGAARLAAVSAIRVGAGLVTLASPPDALMVNACHLTAVMLKKAAGLEGVRRVLDDKRLNVALIGPGYGVGDPARAAVKALLESGRACVLDADALTSFEGCSKDLFAMIGRSQDPVVLTPHAGEFARLFPGLLGLDKLLRAREAAKVSGAVIVLKGADTVIAAPDGRAAINSNASPWLATAGSGDVLAGLVTGLLAQGVPGFEAACQAVWLHGEAGQEAGPGLIAEDLPLALKPVLRKLYELFGK